ncbi:SprT-like family-domain-containing protein [Hypoxylon crocopeplum]|nr:SprT-like family-domain-containing protein [Hypoxylon crocopeplum]
MPGELGSNSEDEFPDVDAVIRQYRHRVQGVQTKQNARNHEGDNGNPPRTEKSKSRKEHDAAEVPAKSSAAAKATPLRRRKLGQSQTVDGSLLKPWNDAVTGKEKEDKTPKPKRPGTSVRGGSTEADDSSRNISEPLPTKTRPAVSRTVSSYLPREQGNLKKNNGKDTLVNNRQVSGRSRKYRTPSDESSGEFHALKDTLQSSDEEVSEFISLSDSESDTWNSDSEPTLTPPTRHPRSPIVQLAKPQRTLFKDPGKKAVFSNKQYPETITGPSKHTSGQRLRDDSVLSSFKASQPGNLEDAFQKLQIFNDDSEPDVPSTSIKGGKKPILEPMTPRKTLPPLPLKTPKIPKSPWKPEQKEFWDAELNFAWIDQHSPDKRPENPKKRQDAQDTKEVMKRKYGTSPEKRDAKKAFNAVKEELARKFLEELDDRITEGQLGGLTKDTGGLRITWSKTLLTTAGRAHWKCKTLSRATKHADGSTSKTLESKQHYASIELASKVLSNEADLLNTVAHEFCHLAVFMLHGKPKAAHGPEFKAWGARCGRAFAHRGIRVSTKHSYDIEYKYVWRCAACAGEVKRHSRSVDTTRQRCGACRGQLVQVKPTPRGRGATEDAEGAAGGGNRKKTSAWNEFMGREMRALSQTNPEIPAKDRMALISAKWRDKGRRGSVKELRAAVEVLEIADDEDEEDGGGDGPAAWST